MAWQPTKNPSKTILTSILCRKCGVLRHLVRVVTAKIYRRTKCVLGGVSGRTPKKLTTCKSMIYEHILAICFSAGGVRVCNRIIVVPFADIYGGLEMSHTDLSLFYFSDIFFEQLATFILFFAPTS